MNSIITGERKWWIWGQTSQDFPGTTKSFFNETCCVDPRETSGSARSSIWMMFCTDGLTSLPLHLQVKIPHVANCLLNEIEIVGAEASTCEWDGVAGREDLPDVSILATGHTWRLLIFLQRKARLPKLNHRVHVFHEPRGFQLIHWCNNTFAFPPSCQWTTVANAPNHGKA